MIKKFSRTLSIVLVIAIICLIGGVNASYIYAIDSPEDVDNSLSIWLQPYEEFEGSEEMVTGELLVTDRFITEINTMLTNPNSTELDETIETRKEKGSSWWPVNEFAADDPASEGETLRKILGLDDFPELTVIIKFVDDAPGYELYTTRVDVDKKDENGNYLIPESEFEKETTFIYPVNRTTFKSDGNGNYVVDHVTVGYSRAIYYYATPTTQTTTRTYDVSTWAEGKSINTAVEIERGIIGQEITVQNIDKQKEVYFKFSVSTRGKYNFDTSVDGLTAVILNSRGQDVTNSNLSAYTTYYLRLNYSTEGTPEDFKFTLQR